MGASNNCMGSLRIGEGVGGGRGGVRRERDRDRECERRGAGQLADEMRMGGVGRVGGRLGRYVGGWVGRWVGWVDVRPHWRWVDTGEKAGGPSSPPSSPSRLMTLSPPAAPHPRGALLCDTRGSSATPSVPGQLHPI